MYLNSLVYFYSLAFLIVSVMITSIQEKRCVRLKYVASSNPSNDTLSYFTSVSGTVKAKVKYGYQRPIFLQLFSDDEIQVTADHMVSYF